MRKNFVFWFFVLSTLLNGSFARAELQQITDKTAAADYIAVITNAFTSAPKIVCINNQRGRASTEAVGSIARHLRAAEEVWVDSSGLQPALKVVTYSPRRKFRFTTLITTSPDLKDVAALATEYADFQRINRGNLVSLKMVDEYVLRETTNCDTLP